MYLEKLLYTLNTCQHQQSVKYFKYLSCVIGITVFDTLLQHIDHVGNNSSKHFLKS